MAYRNKTYVCFDASNDIHYYRLIQAWHQNDNTKFCFYNAHDLNYARDTSLEASIKCQLRQRLLQSKVFVVLVGAQTRYLYRFVRWEIEQALRLELPIIVVNLNGRRQLDDDRCPPLLRNELAIHISFNAAILQLALEKWPGLHVQYKKQAKQGAFYYTSPTYSKFRL